MRFLSLALLHSVSDAYFCLDILWLCRILFDLTPGGGHDGTEHLSIFSVAFSPDCLENGPVCHYLSRILDEKKEQLILKGSEMDLDAILICHMGEVIYL